MVVLVHGEMIKNLMGTTQFEYIVLYMTSLHSYNYDDRNDAIMSRKHVVVGTWIGSTNHFTRSILHMIKRGSLF